MRAADLLKEPISKYRRSINPPYRRKDAISFLGTVLIFLVLPLTVVAVLTVRSLGVPAKGPAQDVVSFTKEFFDEKGNLIATEVNRHKLSGKPESFINGKRIDDVVYDDNVTVFDPRAEKEALKNYIIELETSSLGKKNIELKKAKVGKSDRVKQIKSLKNSIASEHKKIKSQISKAVGKKLVKNNPKKGQRKVKREFDTTINGLVVELLPKEVTRVKKLKGVKRVVKEGIAKITLDSSVPMIHADEAWPFIDGVGAPLTGFGVKIGILDTGVDYNHADLGGCFGPACKVEDGWDFVHNDADPMDDHGHGTHVAATAAGRGTLLGVAPDATVIAYKVCNSGGSCTHTDIIAAIDRCVDPNLDGDFSDHLDVCSMSLGGGGNPDSPTALASDNAMNNGVVVTIAAGNSGPSYETIGTPGTSRESITVGAACKPEDVGVSSRCNTDIASFSSRGPVKWTDLDGNPQEMIKPDIVAPGVNICAAQWDDWLSDRRCKDEKHIAIAGTSMATPHVAGMVALLRQAVPVATPAEIKTAVKTSAVPYSGFDENTQGKGLIHTIEALKILSPDMDFSSKLYSKPFFWSIDGDISGNSFTKNQTFTVHNTTENEVTAAISTQSVPSGLQITTDKNSITVPASGTATFGATLTGDNTVLVSGETYVANIVVDAPVKTLHIATIVRIPNRISTTKDVDFGIDPPDSPGIWTSTKNIDVTNLQDISGTYNTSVDCCFGSDSQTVNGVNVTLSGSSISVPGGSTSSFSATASIDNSIVPNGVYSGTIVVSSAKQLPLRIPFKITKYYRFKTTFPASPLRRYISIHDQNSNWDVAYLKGATTEVTFLLEDKYPVMDVVGYFNLVENFQPFDDTVKFVVKEDIAYDGDETVHLDPATATIKYTVNPKGLNDETIARFPRQKWALKYKNNGVPNIGIGWGNFPPLTYYFNQISSDYVFSVSAIHKYQAATENEVRRGIAFEFVEPNGISADRTFSNTAQDFRLIPVYGYPSIGDDQVMFTPQMCHTGARSFVDCDGISSSDDLKMSKENDYRYDLYVLPTNNFEEIAQTIMYWRLQLNNLSGSRILISPAMLFEDNRILRWPSGVMNAGKPEPHRFYPSTNTNRIDLGVLPYHFNPKWVMREEFKYVTPNIRSQEWDDTFVYDLNYRVSRDGTKIDEGKASKTTYFTDVIGNTPADYVIELHGSADINGVPTNYSIKSAFTLPEGYTSLTDIQSPRMPDFDFLSDNIPAQVVDSSREHLLQFKLDPLPAPFDENDKITSATVRMKTDISDWQDLNVAQDPDTGEYSTSVPVISSANLYTLEISAEDNYNNTFTYSFQVPKGTVPGGDTEPPDTQGDINGDGVVNIFDLSILLSNWGTADPDADLNNDGTVNIFDLSILLSNWST
jgi:subtilisin family serine protease